MNKTYQSTKSGRQIDRAVEITEKLPSQIEAILNEIKILQENQIDKDLIPQKLSDLINDITDQTYNSKSENPQSGKAVAEAIANLLGSAPENLDTLEELAKALNEDENFAAKVIAELTNKADKVDGKDLSTNDFTDADKEKLDGIEEGANKTTVDSELSETSTNPVQNKVVLEALNEKAGSIINSVSGEAIQLTDSANEKLRGLKVYGRTNQVKTTGKNILPYPYDYTNSGTDITITDNGDGTIIINGTTTSERYLYLKKRIVFPKGVTLIFSGCHKEGASWGTQLMNIEHKTSSGAPLFTTNIGANPKTFTIDNDSDYGYSVSYIHLGKGTVCNNFIFKPQIEIGEVATEYEPYSGGFASPSPNWAQPLNSIGDDGSVEVGVYDEEGNTQSFLLSTSNGLLGIPVASDGNYTDSNGQQWVCDEIDFNRGVFIQRINKYNLTGKESWKISTVQESLKEGFTRFDCETAAPQTPLHNSLWSHFQYKGIQPKDGFGAWVTKGYDDRLGLRIVADLTTEGELKAWLQNKATNGEPVTVQYILETPNETTLTEEQISAYKSLQTYKPITNIFNDENAYMKVDYVADTKSYIDNKFAELQAMILEG